ncbi:MAG: YceI family protein [Flavobacteriaceae bacterium]|nr:YceI family protein [Flavobacteriaceae bacterium]
MKKIFLTLIVTSVLLLSFTNIVKTTYKADIKNSKINWKGFKPTGSHNGIISLSSGEFIIENDKIIGGDFTINMNSIIVLDMPANDEYNAKLVDHLKSEDFFDVKKYSTGTFHITGSDSKDSKTLIKGDLTLKGKTNSIAFLATVKTEGDQLTFKSETFKIDRSKYGITYKSKSLFNNLKDKFINDDIEISIEVSTNK